MSLSFRIEQVAEIDSTNEACRLRALAGEAAGLVIRADRQTAGRGRRGRNWSSPQGNLYTSILLRPHAQASEAAALGFAAVMAIGDVLSAAASRNGGPAQNGPTTC
jgi:BirA family biotin operon repressor/biotin-[acetyl-CoA-carboxylase] ligase